jgi:hypothetical protein
MAVLKFFKRKNKVAQIEAKEVDGAEVWMVSWTSRQGDGYYDTHRCAKAFLTEDDAKDFKNSLEEAQQILQNTNNINITIIKQD